jgi:hypothetical protein
MQQVPIYNEKLMSVNDWIREFKDYCRGRNLLGIIMGTEPRGSFLKIMRIGEGWHSQPYVIQ